MKLFAAGLVAAASIFALASLNAPEKKVGLDEAMQTLQGNMKKLDKAFDAKDATKLLPGILEMEVAAHSAKTLVPPKANELKDAKQKDEMIQGFHLQMIELEKSLLDVEAALVQGKIDDAKKVYDEKVKAAKKDGHAKFKD